jgi:hypothetical protein
MRHFRIQFIVRSALQKNLSFFTTPTISETLSVSRNLSEVAQELGGGGDGSTGDGSADHAVAAGIGLRQRPAALVRAPSSNAFFQSCTPRASASAASSALATRPSSAAHAPRLPLKCTLNPKPPSTRPRPNPKPPSTSTWYYYLLQTLGTLAPKTPTSPQLCKMCFGNP